MPSETLPKNQRQLELAQFLPDLKRLGIENSMDPWVLQAYSQDQWPKKLLELRENGPAEPLVDLVVWPENKEAVSQFLKWSHQANVSVYPYGAGSGVCGATIASDQERRPRVMLDLKRMRSVRSIDRKSLTVWAEAGLIGENLERHLNQEGFTLGHFPSSIYCSSLGGYLATRSAGQLSTKYGKIEDMVLSLEFVLPDGRITEVGRAPRSAMGPDWTQFLLGSEGTLGVFTAARLQIHPLPEVRVMKSFGAPDVATAIEFARRILQGGLRPSVFRIYDPLETSLTLKSEILKESGFSGGAAMVGIFEGSRGVTEAEVREAEALAAQTGVEILGPRLAENWWENRYHVSYKQSVILSHSRMIVDTFEVAATWDRLEEVYRAVKNVKAGLGVILGHFSHFYHTGANIYFTLVTHSGLQTASERYDEVWDEMMHAAFEAGATLSHHHGVGTLKNDWIKREKGPWIDFFKKVKNGFDPENRLNPSKMGL